MTYYNVSKLLFWAMLGTIVLGATANILLMLPPSRADIRTCAFAQGLEAAKINYLFALKSDSEPEPPKPFLATTDADKEACRRVGETL